MTSAAASSVVRRPWRAALGDAGSRPLERGLAAAGRQGRRRGKRSGAAFSGAGLGVEVDAGELADAVAGGQRAVRGAGLGRSCTAGIEGDRSGSPRQIRAATPVTRAIVGGCPR